MKTGPGTWTKSIHGAFVCLLAAATLGGTGAAFAGFASTESFLPAVGRIPGKFGAQFYTTIWATNLTGATVHFTFEFLKQGQANPSPASFADTLAAGETKVYENVVETKLGLASDLGAARVTSDGEILVSERIYNQNPGDDLGNTEGLFFAGVPKGFSISLGQSASIQGIDQGGAENFRYNFALVETAGSPATAHVVLYDGDGSALGSRDYFLQPYEQIQPGVDDLAANLATTNARITATVTAGAGSVLLAGAQLANESQDSSGFEMSFRDSLLGGGGGSGVTSLNALTGALTLTPGSGISITPSGTSIEISYTGGGGSGITSVAHDASLSGSGTGGSPLAIANGQVVRSLNGLHDAVSLAAGSNVTLTPSGNTLTIAASGGGGGGLTLPFSGTTSSSSPGFLVTNTGSGSGVQGSGQGNGAGIYGNNSGSGSGGYFYGTAGQGVVAQSANNHGVEGDAGTPGKAGVYGFNSSTGISSYGVWGAHDAALGAGVYGSNPSGTGIAGDSGAGSYAGVYGSNSSTGAGVAGMSSSGIGVEGSSSGSYALYAFGNTGATGIKSFVEPHAMDPSKEIRYVSLEGRESGTYFRGTGRVVGGFATIDVPEDFRMVTSPDGLTAVATPVGGLAVLAVVHQDLDRIVIQGSSDVTFNYVVNGVRKAFRDFEPVSENRDFRPRSPDDTRFETGLPAESVRRLKATGVLNADGSVNLETAHRLGWDQQESWKPRDPGGDRR